MAQRLDFTDMQQSIYLGCVTALFVYGHDLVRNIGCTIINNNPINEA